MTPAAPTLILLPGLDGTGVFFQLLLADLPEHIDTRVIEFPQSGATDYPALLRLLREATADLPSYYLLGSSFSGPLALMLAAQQPRALRGLILCATFLRNPRPRLVPLRFAVVGPLVWLMRLLRRLPVWLLRAQDDPLRLAKRQTWPLVKAGALAARGRAALGVDVRALSASCAQPLLCVSFDQDRVIAPGCTAEILQHLPQARHLPLRGGHLAMVSEPQGLAQGIVDFIAAVEAARDQSGALHNTVEITSA